MNFQINYKVGKEKLRQFKLGVMEYFIQYTSNREAEYVTINYVLPIKQVDQYSITDNCIKSTIRDSNESTFKVDPHDPSFGAKYYSNSKKLVIQINISIS